MVVQSVSVSTCLELQFSQYFARGEGGGEAIGIAVCSHAREEGGGDDGVLVVGGWRGGGGQGMTMREKQSETKKSVARMTASCLHSKARSKYINNCFNFYKC